jgi:hypothetical protein
MADTTNFGWTKPTVGGDAGAWGTILNTLVDDQDTDVDLIKTTADAALPVAGGTMTGNLKFLTESYTPVAQGSVSGAVALDAAAGNFFHMTTTGAITSLTFSNEPVTGTFYCAMVQITAGGSHAVSWGETVNWPGGSAPAQSASGTDVYVVYTYDGGVTWYGARCFEDVS